MSITVGLSVEQHSERRWRHISFRLVSFVIVIGGGVCSLQPRGDAEAEVDGDRVHVSVRHTECHQHRPIPVGELGLLRESYGGAVGLLRGSYGGAVVSGGGSSLARVTVL